MSGQRTAERAIFLMGATACGKTDLSISLAHRIDAEIISVDSALVYRGLDIGTAKPSLVERQEVAHHLIDICDPWDAYSAARFCADARAAIEQIQARGKRVLLVGGTMLYFKALEEGLAVLPAADPELREQLRAEADSNGWPSLHRELARVDAKAASRIHPNDPQRLQRALEVYRLTGVAMSSLQAETRPGLVLEPLKFALVPEDRQWLHARIAERFDRMLAKGFLDEVRAIRDDIRTSSNQPASRCVGYRQAWQYLDGLDNAADHQGARSTWCDQALAATRQLAKRQLTWMRGMHDVTAIACDKLSSSEQLALLVASLKTPGHFDR